MQVPTNRFKADLAAGRRSLGIWLGLTSAYVAEIAAHAGFDWAVIDAEHVPNDLGGVTAQLTALSGHPISPLVRVPQNDPALIKQVLDAGAQTLLCPMVESAEDARAIVRAMRYPPRGMRGVGYMLGRASRFSLVEDYARDAETELCLVVQVESRKGLAAVEEICAVDGVDAVFIGPADLAADMGHVTELAHPEVRAAVSDGLRRISAAGTPAGIIDGPDEVVARDFEDGAQFVALGADVILLAQSMRALADRWKARIGQ